MTDQRNMTNAIISEYISRTEQLIVQFYRIYFNEDYHDTVFKDSYYMIWIEHGPWIIEINDYYFNITDIFVALNEKIPKDILFTRYDYSTSLHMAKPDEPCINLYSYNKTWTKPHTYTNEEIMESLENTKRAKKELENAISLYNQKKSI